MDRSSTPRASQQAQRHANTTQEKQYDDLQRTSQPQASEGRRGKNRSRSGSEELSQIIAQAQANAVRFGAAFNPNGFWPLGEAVSRPESATPTPYNTRGTTSQGGGTNELTRTTSPGLLGWVRNAFMLGPSGRSLDATIESPDEHGADRTSTLPLDTATSDPINRNQTPLLPGILPSFHHLNLQRSKDDKKRAGLATPQSQRSSMSFDESSFGHESIEAYDRRDRRASAMSTDSTASTYDETDDEDNDSDKEDVYAPYAQPQQGPSLIRPTARREALGFGPQLEEEHVPVRSTLFGRDDVDQKRASMRSEHHLSIGEAQESTQYVTDATDEPSSLLPKVVVSASPSDRSDPSGERKETHSPIAGWIDTASSQGEHATSTPRPRRLSSAESEQREGGNRNLTTASQALRTITNDTTPSTDSSSNFRTADDHVTRCDVHLERRRSDTGSIGSFGGDGEDLNDKLGRPKSPEELMRNRQSRESVVLGSRGASTRAGVSAPIRRSRGASQSKSIAEVSDQLRVPAELARRKAASEEDRRIATSDKAGSGKRRPTTSTGASSGVGSVHVSSSASDSVDPHEDKEAMELVVSKAAEAVEGAALPTSPRSRGALGFLQRRRSGNTNADRSPKGHSRSISMDIEGRRKKEGNANSPTPFWKLSRKQASQESPQPPSKSASLRQSDPSATSKETTRSIEKSSPCALSTSFADCSKTRHMNTTHGALGSQMRPRKIKVRSRNKPSKEREFGSMYLAQELHLVSPAFIASSEDVKISSPLASPQLGPQNVAHLPSSHSQVSLTGSDGQGVKRQSSMANKRKATWAMKFSLDGRYLAVAGQDAIIRVYSVLQTPEDRQSSIDEVNRGQAVRSETISSLSSSVNSASGERAHSNVEHTKQEKQSDVRRKGGPADTESDRLPFLFVFSQQPVREFVGHTSDVLDLSWSKGGFLLSASMDSTARIWHMSKANCLVAFKHRDFVTCAVFHPRDDRFFLSGSLDGKLRLWNISSKRIQASQEVPGLITACAFTHSGETACAGTFSGAALFYHTDGLVFASSIAVRSATGKHQKGGRKITAIEPVLPDNGPVTILPSASAQPRKLGAERVLVTSNDGRVRAYDLSTRSIVARFKARTYNNRSSQIRATLSDDNAYIVAGSEATSSSEGGQVHIWECASILFESSMRSLLAKFTSGSLNAVAMANQKTTDFLRSANRKGALPESSPAKTSKGRSAVTSDSVVEYFTAHAGTVTCAIMAPLEVSTLLRQAQDPIVIQSEAKLRNRLAEGAGNLVDVVAGLPMSIGRTIANVVQSPLRSSSASGSATGRVSNGGDGDTFSSSTSSSPGAEIAQLNRKLNRILISVDDNAVVRVWRSDSLDTLSV